MAHVSYTPQLGRCDATGSKETLDLLEAAGDYLRFWN
jgi:hypothetical protein